MGSPSDEGNLLRLPERQDDEEWFEDILRRPGVRIERIVSRGHVTPIDKPYVQDWDEWVLVIQGCAELLLEDVGTRRLERGDHLLIPAGVSHRVTNTDDPTVWLAVHIGQSQG